MQKFERQISGKISAIDLKAFTPIRAIEVTMREKITKGKQKINPSLIVKLVAYKIDLAEQERIGSLTIDKTKAIKNTNGIEKYLLLPTLFFTFLFLQLSCK